MTNEPTINESPEPTPNTTRLGDIATARTLQVSPLAPELDAANAKTLHEPGPVCAASAGQQFGEYELISEIARGGMGVVYRARQHTLDRVVALKMILAGRLANPDDVLRFRTEAEAAAKLQHPNIVAVHNVGAHEGQHFFTMEYIDGVSLDQRLTQGPLDCKTAARYVRILARAVHYAHKQGILHRDLKPSNILIDANDEPTITDFGLAKRLGKTDSGQTRTGAVLGTPSYMSPEQAQGKSNDVGPAADIYSLGAILYELITGRPPFRAASPMDTLLQVIDNDPVPPTLLNSKIDHDIETICLKCLEKNPSLRYGTADDLAADLQRYLDGDSISARSFNVLERMARTLERDVKTADFSGWSTMCLLAATVVFIEHVAVFMLVWFEQDRRFVSMARFAQLVSLGCLFWYNRRGRLLPQSAAERELWTIWIGYFATYFFTIITTRVLKYRETFDSEQEAFHYFQDLLPYPFISLISGLAFFIMGSNYWGRCYAVGAVFFIAAPLMAFNIWFGPLIFGVLWTAILLMFSWHLRNQAPKVVETNFTSLSQKDTILYKDANHP